MTNPLQTLRDALGEAQKKMLVLAKWEENIHMTSSRTATPYTNGIEGIDALTRAESALRELEAEPRYTVGQFFDALDAELELDKLDPLLQAYKDAIKRRLAGRGEK